MDCTFSPKVHQANRLNNMEETKMRSYLMKIEKVNNLISLYAYNYWDPCLEMKMHDENYNTGCIVSKFMRNILSSAQYVSTAWLEGQSKQQYSIGYHNIQELYV